ncbi:hypothetical protein NQ315_014785 [Exocentrus adspersus]|uniref:Endonuclease/exonuclease/phosphatase domain-containing protein n=1 Tax=Exocentrus adspersus TaxID=1586481 RepID=A0AAV8VMR8_9CUCU|nr:hypothetical protein NQ315_014785 [Exocentrus adspersus]
MLLFKRSTWPFALGLATALITSNIVLTTNGLEVLRCEIGSLIRSNYLWSSVRGKNVFKVIYIVAYRPPKGDFHVFIEVITEALRLASFTDRMVLCGDFNIDVNARSSDVNIFNDLMDCFKLNLTIREPTRIFTYISGHTSSSCLDYMVTNYPLYSIGCEIYNPHMSDHRGHILKINNAQNPENHEKKLVCYNRRSQTESDFRNFNNLLSQTDWTCIQYLDLNEAYKYFIEAILWCYNVSCPLRKIKLGLGTHTRNREWLTSDIVEQSIHLKNLYWLMSNLRNVEVQNLYKSEKKKFKNNIISAKQQYYSGRIDKSSNKARETWKIVNHKLETAKLLTISQHGFRLGKSIETASCHLLEYVYECLDSGKYVVSLLFDLCKAFDTISKDILKRKLEHMGIRGLILSWLMSYMSDRFILNKNKTVVINFGIQKLLPIDISLHSDFELSPGVKLLGTYFDANLSYDIHIEYVCKQMNKAYFALLQLKSVLDERSILSAYYALAYSHMAYNIICWGSAVEMRRKVVGLYSEKKRILTLPSVYILKCVTFVSKNRHCFRTCSYFYSYSTGSGKERSPYYNSIVLFNALPSNIRDIPGYSKFKAQVKKLLLDNVFYSVSEYLDFTNSTRL